MPDEIINETDKKENTKETNEDHPTESHTSEEKALTIESNNSMVPSSSSEEEKPKDIEAPPPVTPESNPEAFPDPNWNEREHRALYDKQIKGQTVYICEVPFLVPLEQVDVAVTTRNRLVEKCEKLGAKVLNKEPSSEYWEPRPGIALMKKEAKAFAAMLPNFIMSDIIIFGDSYYKTRFAIEISNTIEKLMKTVIREVELDDLIYINEH